MLDQIKQFMTPEVNTNLTPAHEYQRTHLPTLWLLGKTGAGKSTLIKEMTNATDIEIGNGFAPCTTTASSYELPADKPIMKFVDTRGLGEAHYDPAEDIAYLGDSANVLIVVMRLDDPEQSDVLAALKQIKKQRKQQQMLLVLTTLHTYHVNELKRLSSFQQQQVETVWGEFTSVNVQLSHQTMSTESYADLVDALAELLPSVGLVIEKQEHSTIEEQNFARLEKEVLWYSGTASASDLIPAVGLVTVPAIQGKMLHSLAAQYDVEWNKRVLSELVASLGSSFAVQYSVKLGARQLVKLIPGWGQTVGSVSAAAISFATTYALGRAACYYFYQRQKGEAIDNQTLQSLYKRSLSKAKTEAKAKTESERDKP